MTRINPVNYIENTKGKDINLKEYYEVIKKRILLIVALIIIATTAGYFYNSQNEVLLYQTSTRIIIGPEAPDMQTLMVMIKDPIIMEKVRDELQLDRSASGIAGSIAANRIDESRIVEILVTDTDPYLAADIANATARIYKSEIVNLLAFEDVQLLSPAAANPSPINETGNRFVIFAFVFGLLLGLGLAFLLDSLDGTIKREREVEEILGVPVIGVISNMNKKKFIKQRNKQPDLKLRGETVDLK
ncbi:YveK family protein [Jeotgalibacillus soli]|uniref:Polysaccharide chain length determinant N-terminal domain-containing protein n=1 Tax=Jeotgalibacillus soli TaxID=889306 RepID=A0A0C2VZF7_9BACL|nr:capsular biosynthesis protein [Jeotgalibacillus soli]KIL49343.1 hypothetical protein KP78_08110 [Jeotgalibacillus soli]